MVLIKGISNIRALNKNNNSRAFQNVIRSKTNNSEKVITNTTKTDAIESKKTAKDLKSITKTNRRRLRKRNTGKKVVDLKAITIPADKVKNVIPELKTEESNEKASSSTGVGEVKTPKRRRKIKKEIADDIKDKTSIKREEVTLALKTLFDTNGKHNGNKQEVDTFNIQLYIYNVQIPQCPSRTIRISIPHTIVPESASMCLIAHDVKNDGKFDEDATVSYYNDLLRSRNVINIPVVIPMHMLKTKYNNFELKRQLMNQYDILLVDVRVSGHAYHLMGKTLEKKNKCLTPIKLETPELIKSQMTAALQKTKITLNSKADTSSVLVGHSKMRIEDIAQNTLVIIRWLVRSYPGGWTNIRALSLKSDQSPPVPIYWSTVDSDTIKAPNIPNNKRKLVKTVNEVYLSKKGEQIKVKGGRIMVINKNAEEKEIEFDNIESNEEESDSESGLKIYD